MSVLIHHLDNSLVKTFAIALMPIIKKSTDASRVKNFDEKLQRSYFLVGKK